MSFGHLALSSRRSWLRQLASAAALLPLINRSPVRGRVKFFIQLPINFLEVLALDTFFQPAQEGGNSALVQNGDMVTLDAVNNCIEIDVSDEALASRKESWQAPPLKFTRGTLGKYVRYVKNASMGCVTDEE